MKGLARRQVLRALAGAGVAGMGAQRSLARPPAAGRHVWQGTALGGAASLVIEHPEAEKAQAAIGEALAEVRRLEKVFSLYRPDSALSRLNREGGLNMPPLDLVRILSEARRVSEATGGAFDVTVQPLWTVYARHFAQADADPSGPPPEAVSAARDRVDYRAVAVTPARITLEKPGMAVTLNGIAEGYITDRICERLRASGFAHALVNLGEIRAIGAHTDGRPWRAAIADPRQDGALLTDVELVDRALATSAGSGTPLDPAGKFTHLFDPRTGRSAPAFLSVSVMADTATLADALATAFSTMTIEDVTAFVRTRSRLEVLLLTGEGKILRRISPR